MRDLSQTITIRSTLESDWPQIRELRIENATDNPISYGATLRTTQRMDEDAWRLRGRRGEGPDTACLAAVDTTTGRWVGMMSGQMRSRTGLVALLIFFAAAQKIANVMLVLMLMLRPCGARW